MRFRFRKSIKAGPLRINLSKSGVGYSVGGKGYRYTKKANGGTRQTWSIPGTGISYVDHTPAKKKETNVMQDNISRQSPSPKKCPNCGAELTAQDTQCPVCGELITFVSRDRQTPRLSAKQKKPIYKRWWFIWIVVSLIYGCISMCTNDPADPTETLPTQGVETIAPTTEMPTEASETTAITIPETEAPTTEPLTEPSTESPTEDLTEAPATEATTEPKEEERAYVLNTSSHKFHYPSCSSVDTIKASNRSDVTTTRSALIDQGYSPCGRCHP